jgi:hypothetical protein
MNKVITFQLTQIVIVPSKIESITILINNYIIAFSLFYYFNQTLNDNPTRIIIELGVCVF